MLKLPTLFEWFSAPPFSAILFDQNNKAMLRNIFFEHERSHAGQISLVSILCNF